MIDPSTETVLEPSQGLVVCDRTSQVAEDADIAGDLWQPCTLSDKFFTHMRQTRPHLAALLQLQPHCAAKVRRGDAGFIVQFVGMDARLSYDFDYGVRDKSDGAIAVNGTPEDYGIRVGS